MNKLLTSIRKILSTNFDANDLWLSPDGTKANATVLLDGLNGVVIYDGLKRIIWSKELVAGFNVGDSVSIITNQWKETATSSGTSNGTATGNKILKLYDKKFGINKLKLIGGLVDLDRSTDGFGVDGNVTVKLQVGSQFDEFTTNLLTPRSFELEVDLSPLTGGTIYTMSLVLSVFVDGLDAAATLNTAEATFDDSIVILEEP